MQYLSAVLFVGLAVAASNVAVLAAPSSPPAALPLTVVQSKLSSSSSSSSSSSGSSVLKNIENEDDFGKEIAKMFSDDADAYEAEKMLLDEKSWFDDIVSGVSEGLKQAGEVIDNVAKKTVTAWTDFSEKYQQKLKDKPSGSLSSSGTTTDEPEEEGNNNSDEDSTEDGNSVSQKTAKNSDEYVDSGSNDVSDDN